MSHADMAELPDPWMVRQRMKEQEWAALLDALPGRVGVRACNGDNTRDFVEAVLWIAQTGAYWSDLPPEYGSWRGTYVRFVRWAREGNWDVVLDCMRGNAHARELQSLVQRYLRRHKVKSIRQATRAVHAHMPAKQ